ncbi:MAG: hypothetical protein ACR2L1_08145 [Pyrinomonadaceae bacterium]
MKLNLPLLLIIAIFFSVGQSFAQDDAANVAKDVKLQISFTGEKTVYQMGEPIKLILSYTSTEPGYVVERYYSPRFDDVIVSPTDGVYDWLYRLNRLYSYDDVSMREKLSESPVKIDITVNDLVRFDKPGKYKIKVVSRRVSGSKEELSFRSQPTLLSSNEIELEVKEMSQIDERAEVKRITALMDSATNLNQHQIYKRDFDYLTGDASTVEKVHRFLNPPVYGGVTWLDSGKGLDIARNKTLAIKLLEAVFRDLNREPSRELIGKLVTLRILLEDERQPNRAANSEQLWKERDSRSSELNQAYYAELLDSLSKRSGKSQIVTAYTIFTSLPRDDTSSAAFNITKTFLLEKFDELTPYGRVELLDRFWDKIKNPSLVPSLEKILLGKEPTPAWQVRDNALKRLIEIDQKRARPFVINEIRDPDSFINPDILVKLDDKFLPETDDALLEQIKNLAATNDNRMRLNLQFKLTLAARYATAKIYGEMLEVYKKYGANWPTERSGPLLSYLARHNDEETLPLIEEQLNKSGDRSGFNFFYTVTKTGFTKGMEKLLQKRLESDDQQIAGGVAYYLSKNGGRENISLIEKRYNRWLEKWNGRGAELENPNAAAEVKGEAMFQINLLEALIRAEGWKLPETEVARLKLTCLTDNCRRHFSARH